MIVNRTVWLLVCLVTTISWSVSSLAQEPATPKDEALDSLIEKLSGADQPNKAKDSSAESGKDAKNKPGSSAKRDTDTANSKPAAKAKSGTTQAGKPSKPTKPGSGDVSAKDKELDQLLEKLGESSDEPAAEDRPRGRPQPGDKPDPPQPSSGKTDKSKQKPNEKDSGLQGKDKELDERLEEFAGRKRKKNRPDQQDGSGPLGEIIKEMKDVEQRLGKPDTSEDTQGKQKQIVKRIETMIERMRQSGSSSSMAMRQVSRPGEKPGKQPGQTAGASANGAPPAKPAKPSSRHSMAGGKDIWGHLPDELRQEMDNVSKEDPLESKEDLIRRYYLSVSKRKLVRGD